MSMAETVLGTALADGDGLEHVLARLEWTLLDFRRHELPRGQGTDDDESRQHSGAGDFR